jgi:hypothetical protein
MISALSGLIEGLLDGSAGLGALVLLHSTGFAS